MVRVLKMPHQESYDESDHREALTAIEPYRDHVLIGIPILISWSHTCSSACSALKHGHGPTPVPSIYSSARPELD